MALAGSIWYERRSPNWGVESAASRRLLVARLVERLADRAHAPIHHVGRRDHVRARFHVRQRRARDEVERRIVHDPPILDHAAVPVAGVLAEAHVGHDEQVGNRLLHGADGLLDDAVLRVRLAAARVLLLRQAEQEHSRNAHGRRVLALAQQLVDGEPGLPRHRPDRVPHPSPVDDEEWVHQVVRAQRGLAHHLPHQRRLAQATRSIDRVRHR
jgi:hypothetical protein